VTLFAMQTSPYAGTYPKDSQQSSSTKPSINMFAPRQTWEEASHQ